MAAIVHTGAPPEPRDVIGAPRPMKERQHVEPDESDGKLRDLVAFMGGFDVDLREADIEGDQALITITAFMGGGVLRVPENWAVSMQVGAFMGGHSLKTRETSAANKTLVVKGLAVMGGVEVRN